MAYNRKWNRLNCFSVKQKFVSYLNLLKTKENTYLSKLHILIDRQHLYEDLERVLFSIINRSVFSRSTSLAIRMFSLSIYVLFCLVIGSANGLLTSNSLLAIPVLFSACKVIDV